MCFSRKRFPHILSANIWFQRSAMDHVRSIIRLIDQGVSAQVMLPDGTLIAKFTLHDLIARGNPDAGILVVRGRIGDDTETPEDKVIPLCDIRGIFAERPHRPVVRDPAFLARNPVARGWTVIYPRS